MQTMRKDDAQTINALLNRAQRKRVDAAMRTRDAASAMQDAHARANQTMFVLCATRAFDMQEEMMRDATHVIKPLCTIRDV